MVQRSSFTRYTQKSVWLTDNAHNWAYKPVVQVLRTQWWSTPTKASAFFLAGPFLTLSAHSSPSSTATQFLGHTHCLLRSEYIAKFFHMWSVFVSFITMILFVKLDIININRSQSFCLRYYYLVISSVLSSATQWV